MQNVTKSVLIFGLCLLIVTLIAGAPATAQDTLPMAGPLLAANTVEQDAILLYDLGSDRFRELRLDDRRAHHVWDFSPDGCRVLLTLAEGTLPARLISVRLDGSDPRELVRFDELAAPEWGVWEPDWSPDGDDEAGRIAFTMLRGRGETLTTHIAWVPGTGGTPEFYSVTGREFTPQWSPDGRWLAYVSYDERAAGANVFATAVPTPEPPPGQTPPPPVLLNEADLWVVSADGETKTRLTSFPTGNVSMPRWSPDGDLVGFVYSPSPNNDTLWMIANQAESIPTQLSFQWHLVLDLTWLPDSTAMIGALRDFRQQVANRLWQIPLVGSADELSLEVLSDLNLVYADYPRYSPDGRWLAVRSAYALALVDLEARTVQNLPERFVGNTPTVWSPAGFSGEAACD